MPKPPPGRNIQAEGLPPPEPNTSEDDSSQIDQGTGDQLPPPEPGRVPPLQLPNAPGETDAQESGVGYQGAGGSLLISESHPLTPKFSAGVGEESPRFAGYEILGELGRGGMGIVYKAHDRQRNQVVALKTLPGIDPGALYRFKQEFRTLSDVTHPNLVTLYELISDGQQWFFTMEFVPGADFLTYVGCGGYLTGETEAQESEVRYPGAGGSLLAPDSCPLTPRITAAQQSRLREGLRQLVQGVLALHEGGKLHRDIKPRNVLVTSHERVVLLDFGIAAELGNTGLHHSTEEHIIGTAGYMAPEQAAGQAVSAASDWYSIGVMLYEALTGQLPFQGPRQQVLRDKQDRDPPAPADLAPGIPEDLNALCVELLRRDPAERPGGREVLRRLEQAPREPQTAARGGQRPPSTIQPVSPPSSSRQRVPLVGRERHLATLSDAFRTMKNGRTMVLFVHGNSGMGKSALVQHFLDGLGERREAVVLAGRCYEQESVPYKALDSLVDALSQYLRRLPAPDVQALMPRDGQALARVFPVLRQVEAMANAPERGFVTPDQQERRRRAFGALRELLARVGDRAPLVLFIDDLQWGDVDSAAMLAELLRPPDPPVLFLLACYRREDVERSRCLQALLKTSNKDAATVEWRELAVDPLSSTEARSLAAALLESGAGPVEPASRRSEQARCLFQLPEAPGIAAHAGAPAAALSAWPFRPFSVSQQAAEGIGRESGGNPFFVFQLVQSLQDHGLTLARGAGEEVPALDKVLWARITLLPEAARRLLEVVAVAGAPLRRAEAYPAAELGTHEREALAILRSGRLIRGTGLTEQEEIETYHDRIRETIIARLPSPTLQDHHRRLALALQASGQADPEVLAVHFQGAGETTPAGQYYALAAHQAAEALAFDRAAKLYRLALELRSPEAAPLAETAKRGQGETGTEAPGTAAHVAAPAAALSAWPFRPFSVSQQGGSPRLPDESHGSDLRTKLADALANAGRGAEAAREYLAAAATADGTGRLDLQRRAAYQYLISGHFDAGQATMEMVVRAAGLKLPATPRRALWSLLLRRCWLRIRGLHFHERGLVDSPLGDFPRPPKQGSTSQDSDPVSQAELARLDTYWSAATGMALIDIIRAADLQVRGLLLALRVGDPFRITRAIALEAIYSSAYGKGSHRHTAKLLRAAEDLAPRIAHPYARGVISLARGASSFLEADFRAAQPPLAEAEEIFRDRCTGVAWELDLARFYRLMSLLHLGEVADLARRAPALLKQAQERSDLFAATNLNTYIIPFILLGADDPERARRTVRQAMGLWSQQGFHTQHCFALVSEIQIDLYKGAGSAAWERLRAQWPAYTGSLLRRIQHSRIVMSYARARSALAAAADAADPGPFWRAAEGDGRRLEREKVAWSVGLAGLVRAGLAMARGDADKARAQLMQALIHLDGVGTGLYAAAARHRLGCLVGGQEGRALAEQAQAWMGAQEIANPSRMTVALVPGFPTDDLETSEE